MKQLLLCMAAIAAMVAVSSSAEEIDEEIVVTATKVEKALSETLAPVNVITQLDVEHSQSRDLPSLLGRIPGIQFRDSGGRGSTSGLFVRGTTPAQTLVLIDGVRSGSATTGSMDLANIPLGAIERIEVVRGPLSGLYGADALGGVIQIFTMKDQDPGLNGNLRMTAGSHQLREYRFSIGAGNDRQRYHASIAKEDTAGIDRTSLSVDGNEDRDSFEETSGNLSAQFAVSDQLEAKLSYLRSEGRSEFDSVFGADDGSYSKNELENLGVKLSYSPTSRFTLSLDLGANSDRVITPVYSSDFHTRRKSASLLGNFSLSGNQELVIGTDFERADVTADSSYSSKERNNQSLFAQWHGYYGDISVITNLRHDNNDQYGEDTNGSLAVGYAFDPDLQLVVRFGTAFRAPTFNDLYFPFYGNPGILPEESSSYELMLQGHHDGFDWRMSAYRSEAKNLIGYDWLTFAAGNIAEASLEGIEAELNWKWDAWEVVIGLEYLDARDEKSNEYLDDRAMASGHLGLGWTAGRLFLAADVALEHGRHDLTGLQLPGYASVGLAGTFDITDRLKIKGRVDNLFDKDYTLNMATYLVAYETDGRSIRLTIEYGLR